MNFDPEKVAASYHEDGYVVVRQLFSKQEIEEFEANLAAYLRDVVPALRIPDVYYEDPPSKAIKSMFRLQKHAFSFSRLGSDPRLTTMMRAIFTEGDVLCDDVGFFGKMARDGSITPPHQDNAFNFWTPPYCLKASIALDPATPENGAMFVQKGSHKIGILPHRPSDVLGFSQTMVEPLDTSQYPEIQLCLEPGDLALHHTNCVHRSDANRTSQSRRMLSLVYRSSVAKHDDVRHARYKQQAEELLRRRANQS